MVFFAAHKDLSSLAYNIQYTRNNINLGVRIEIGNQLARLFKLHTFTLTSSANYLVF